MDKNAIKKYAVWAREELIKRVSTKAEEYGISKEDMIPAAAESVNGRLLTKIEISQRSKLISAIRKDGYEQVVEEVAYTWFNRFIALRFMEVNKLLPSRVRVFTNAENEFKPQILAEALSVDIKGLDIEKVIELKKADKKDELYKYLLITQCNALSAVLPKMFQKIDDYTELLFPDNILREGSVIERLISWIPENDWLDAVQIIGWMYQFYNIEPKAEVFANNGKISKDEIPAATQLFTPDWIVRYMVENSLGRLWVEGHPNDALKGKWDYYLDEAEQEETVKAELEKLRAKYKTIKPEDIKCIDPCMGSGHILVYMFDILMDIYADYGYSPREAVISIIENNLYGLDIDERAAQLSYFAVMMKACAYDKRFLNRKDENGNPNLPQPHVYAIVESNGLDHSGVDAFINGDAEIKNQIDSLIEQMKDAEEYGSILNISGIDFDLLYNRLEEMKGEISIFGEVAIAQIGALLDVAFALAQKYEVVVTNPPYMPVSNAGAKLNGYVKNNYPDSKTDLFAVFIERCKQMIKTNGYQAMITMHSWMFLSSYEKLREKMLLNDTVNMVHLGARAFEEIGGEVVQTTAFVRRNSSELKYKGVYCRLIEPNTQQGKEDMFLSGKNRFSVPNSIFANIPGCPFAYWISETLSNSFNNEQLGDYAQTKQGFATGDNNKFLRFWHETSVVNTMFPNERYNYDNTGNYRWFPCNKGGSYRKWYGNNYILVNWYNGGSEMRAFKGSVIRNPQFYFKAGITWSSLANQLSLRYSPKGIMFESKGSMCFVNDEKQLLYFLGLLNSKIATEALAILSPTLDFHEGPMLKVPAIVGCSKEIDDIVINNIEISRYDWDSFETSWDFKRHPLVEKADALWDATAVGAAMQHYYGGHPKVSCPLELCYMLWQGECNERFNNLKANEEELNRIFIDIYGLQDELTPEVEDKDVTVRKADLQREIKSFISYAVGCMFGRYSLDVEGLAYAGGEFDHSKYVSFPADCDNIIPICDDEYFEDDIVGRFIKFVEVVYGKETLQENLKFIADALGGKGTPKEVIRNYFINDFYADHLKMYQKRPIYWLFDSGKKNGFKALMYMHRYKEDTLARMRTDYVHEQQARYRTAIADLEHRIANAGTAEKVKLTKQLTKLKDQDTEIRLYEEKIHHLADQMIRIDLDDGVKNNYEIFKDVLAKLM